ncbi:hypothetical protein GALMADRAFT_233335 [Galerina marginata CBS 339.88]|uniref:Uncharacterized protein n=1 Tax=Galerina marginata (strain CBS 339.88) TaxID=685588 RepID=A0A067TNZ2_GALM3|nr:hypothetical protein GALMADRAFT_233335 [Galerina marginata CBS 339.88]
MPPQQPEHTDMTESIPFATQSDGHESEVQDNAATHYTGGTKGKFRWSRYFRLHFTPRGITDRLLRKTVRRNTWIYISDKNCTSHSIARLIALPVFNWIHIC